jgi:hypothetical protein
MRTPKRAKKLLIFVTSTALTFYVYNLFMSFGIATAVLTSLLVHEAFHFFAFRRHGFTAGMFFLVLFAGVIPDNDEALKVMPRYQEAFIAIAGPAGNVVLILVGALFSVVPEWRSFGFSFMELNASLAAFNLLPFFMLDGARVAKALYSSADEKHDKKIAMVLSACTLPAIGIMLYTRHWHYLPVLFVYGHQRASERDNPYEHFSPRSMKALIVNRVVGVYAGIMIVALTLMVLLSEYNIFN